MAAVDIQQLGKTFGKSTVLRGVDLRIPDGRRTVVLGRSGSGKTTLLRLIAGLEAPTEGKIAIGGQPMDRVPPHRRNVAMTFQHDALLPHRSIRENVEFPLLMAKVNRVESEQRAQALLELMGIEGLADRRPDSLSGGQRQLAALARALVRRPNVVLMDEPFAHLDTPLRAEIRRRVVEIQERLETTMLLVTHDQREALELAEHLVMLHGNTIAYTGPPDAAYRCPPTLAVAKFLGDPPLNTVALSGDSSARSGWTRAAPPGTATVGIRPQHLQLAAAAEAADNMIVMPCRILRTQDQGAEFSWEVEAEGVVVRGVGAVPTELDSAATPALVVDARGLLCFDDRGQRIDIK